MYVAHDLTPKPVVVLFHGSGCTPEFTVDADTSLHETSIWQDAISEALQRVHVAIVERSGVDPLVFVAGMTEAQKRTAFENAERECSSDYYRTAAKPIRVEDGITAIRALKQQPWTRGVIMAGHSEGTEVVTGLLHQFKDADVSVAGLFASAGPIRFFCGYAARGPGNRELYDRVFNRIRMLQGADDALMWQGLPARRWKTFWLDSTPIEDVQHSTVPLFLAQGERDDTTLCADLFALEAIRQQPSRPIRYVVVEQGNHAFETPDGRSLAAGLFQDFLAWALGPNRETSLATLK